MGLALTSVRILLNLHRLEHLFVSKLVITDLYVLLLKRI